MTNADTLIPDHAVTALREWIPKLCKAANGERLTPVQYVWLANAIADALGIEYQPDHPDDPDERVAQHISLPGAICKADDLKAEVQGGERGLTTGETPVTGTTALSPDREPVGKKMTDEEFQNFWGKGINPPVGKDAVGRLRAVLTEIANLPPALLPSQLVDRFIEVRMKAKAALDETSADCCGSQGNVTAPVGKDEVEGLIEKLDKRATLEEWACDGDRELDVLLRKATTTIRALHSRNKAMKEALEPFGKEAEKFEGVPDNVYAYKNTPYTVRQYGDEQALKYCRITIEDLRRARALSTGER
jgi:hypothetical protein